MLLSARFCCAASCNTPCNDTARFALSIIAFIGTLIGIILAGAGKTDDKGGVPGYTLQKAIDDGKSAGVKAGPGMGVSIAAVIFQAIALGATVYKRFSAPKAGVSKGAHNTQSPLSRF